MTPGSTFIKKCSACCKPIEQHTIGSGNTFGATFWTDGKCDAPMLPDQPWLVMCPHCHVPLWIDELEVLGEGDGLGSGNGEFKDARRYESPVLDDYFELIDVVADPQKERYIRLRAWWGGNDERRVNAAKPPMSSREMANLTALANMLDESDDNDLVMKAEAMRELGKFDNALSLLAKSADQDIREAVAKIKSLAEERDTYVRNMDFK